MLGVLAYLPTVAFVTYINGAADIAPRVGGVVSLTLLTVCTLATLVGSLLPCLPADWASTRRS